MDLTLLNIVFVVVSLGIIVYDYWRVATGKMSLSLKTWLAEQAHPTLIVGVLLVGLFGAYFTRQDWIVAFSIALATGHLVTSEGAAIATSTAKRWTIAK